MTAPGPRGRAMSEPAAQAAIDQACRLLRLPTIRTRVEEFAAAAAREQLSYWGFLAELLLAECDDRDRRRSARRVKAAGFPREKWLADFDFEANSDVNPALIHTLAKSEWIRKGEPLCLIGDSGTGKTHLLIALGIAAAQDGFRVRYTLPQNWSTSSSRPPTTVSWPAPSPATAASICSASMNWATWNWTGAAPNCSSRY
jgi:DNA replication protein DnaC